MIFFYVKNLLFLAIFGPYLVFGCDCHNETEFELDVNETQLNLEKCCEFSLISAELICECKNASSMPTLPSELDSLRLFGLSNTNIVSLEDGVFGQRAIKRIELVDNFNLRLIRPASFEGLRATRELFLRNADLTETHDFFGLFSHLENLTRIDVEVASITSNSLLNTNFSTRPNLSQNSSLLPCLKSLNLRGNALMHLTAETFDGLKNSPLQYLSLRSCGLKSMQKDTLAPLTGLNHLDLFNNHRLFEHFFENNKSLGLYHLKKLEILDLSANSLLEVPYAILEEVADSLRTLKLQWNNFIHLGENHKANTFPWMPNLRTLNLDTSRIQQMDVSTFQNLPCLEELSLRDNILFSIPSAVARLSNLKSLKLQGLPVLFTNGNRFKIPDEIFVDMKGLEALHITHTNFDYLGPKSFRGLHKLRSLVLDHCVLDKDLIENDVFSELKELENLSLAECKGFERLPDLINQANIRGMEDVNLSRVQIFDDAGQVMLFGRVTNSSCNSQENYKIRHLNLTQSLLRNEDALNHLALSSMPSLESIVLDRNRFTGWSTRQFSNNARLKKLSLSVNYDIITLTSAMIEDFRNLSRLDLTFDYFVCNEGVANFTKMVWNNPNLEVVDFNQGQNYVCRLDNFTLITFLDYSSDPQALNEGTKPYREPLSLAQILIPLTTIFILVLVAGLLANRVYSQRWYLQYKWTKMRLARERRRQLLGQIEMARDEFVYDAFVSYHNKDKHIVYHTLLPALEEGSPKLRICVHERDFAVGKPIMENILCCLESSRACIILLSNHYLKSEWCKFEAQMAFGMLKKKNIVVIMIKDIQGSLINKTLRTIITMRTYLELKDDVNLDAFGKRLRLAIGALHKQENNDENNSAEVNSTNEEVNEDNDSGTVDL